MERLSEQDIARMKKVLHHMSVGYLNGVDYRSLRNMTTIPAKALQDSIKNLKA